MNRPCQIAFAILLALAGICLIVVVRAAAHDWYPMECCHAMDCAPVDKVEVVSSSFLAGLADSLVPSAQAAPSTMIVTTRHGTVAVPANFPQRQSKDHRMQACMRPSQGGSMRLICIFLPPAM